MGMKVQLHYWTKYLRKGAWRGGTSGKWKGISHNEHFSNFTKGENISLKI